MRRNAAKFGATSVGSIRNDGIVIISTVSAVKREDFIFSYSRNIAGMADAELPDDTFKSSARKNSNTVNTMPKKKGQIGW